MYLFVTSFGAGGGSTFFGGAFGTNLGFVTPPAAFLGAESSLLIVKLDGGREGGRSAIVHDDIARGAANISEK